MEKTITVKFSPDEKVKFNNHSRLFGSVGYIESITINSNGILYSVIVTDNLPNNFKPKKIEVPHWMLESLE